MVVGCEYFTILYGLHSVNQYAIEMATDRASLGEVLYRNLLRVGCVLVSGPANNIKIVAYYAMG